MAILKNLGNTTELHFTLLKSEEPQWLNYKIEFYIITKEGLKERIENLSLTNHSSLFLDRVYDPEISNFIEGVRNTINGAGLYSFSPVDDRDFIIEIKPEKLYFQFNYFIPKETSDTLLGLRMKVDAESLNKFIIDLGAETLLA